MDETTDEINLEIKLFRKSLKLFSENTNEIHNETVTLLKETVSGISDIITKLKVRNKNPNCGDDLDWLANVSDRDFQYRRIITCFLCHTQINLSFDEFDAHIRSKSHKAKERQRYFDSVTPLTFLPLTPLEDSPPTAKRFCGNDEIDNTDCNTIDFSRDATSSSDASSSYNRFKNGSDHEQEKPSQTPPSLLSLVTSNVRTLIIDENFLDLVQVHQIKQSINEFIQNSDSVSSLIVSDLSNVINNYHPGRCEPYGSRMYGLGSKNSNMNILVDFNFSGKFLLNESVSNGIQNTIANHVNEKFNYLFTVNAIKDNEHQNQLNLLHRFSLIDCLISFDRTDSESTKVLRYFFREQPICRYLIAYLKIWQEKLNYRCADGGFKFNTYLLAMLVVSLFQVRRKLPSGFEITIQNLDLRMDDMLINSSYLNEIPDNIYEYLLDFFTYYGEIYQYKRHVISAYTGDLQSREMSKKEKRPIQPARLRFNAAMQKNPQNWDHCAMCVQDLLNPDINVASNVYMDEIESFQLCCHSFADIFRQKYSASSKWTNTSIPATVIDLFQTVVVNTLSRAIYAKSAKGAKKILTAGKNKIVIKCLKEYYSFCPNVKIYQYGSFVNNIGTANSDLNIFIDYANMYNTSNKINIALADNIRMEIIKLLSRNASAWTGIKENDRFSPNHSILAVYKKENLKCRITIQSGVPVATWQLIDHFMNIQPIYRQLILTLRYWDQQIRSLAQTPFKFSGYFYTLLVMVFLQMCDLLPFVCTIQNVANVKKIKCGDVWVHYDSTVTAAEATESLDYYLKGFFAFYGQSLNPSTFIVSPFHGKLLRLDRINEIDTAGLPADEKETLEIMQWTPNFWKAKHFYVQDIFQRNINIAADVPKAEIESFQKCCQLSYSFLQN